MTSFTLKRSLAVLALAACTTAPARAQQSDSLPPTVTLPAELARVLTDYEAAWPRGGAATAELFVEDGFVLSGGGLPVRGRAAIAKRYGTSNGALALRAFAYGMDGNVAFILGGYASSRGASDAGKFTLTLRKRADGRWMIVSDMDNPNRPPQRPPPSGLRDGAS